MSNQQNEELKLKILDEITSMSVDEFQTLCERHDLWTNGAGYKVAKDLSKPEGFSGIASIIDITIFKLVNIEFEDRSN
jgi:hypothetical protein